MTVQMISYLLMGNVFVYFLGKADQLIVVAAEHAGITTSVTVNLVFPVRSVH